MPKQTLLFPIGLGDEVRDRVTGFQGIVASLTEWFNRCQRAGVQPPIEEGKMTVPAAEAFDVEQLDIVVHQKVVQKGIDDGASQKPTTTGGPMPNVRQHDTPKAR